MTVSISCNADLGSAGMQPFQTGLPVRLIATRRADLTTCAEDQPIAEVADRNRDTQFDFLPVTGKTAGDEGQIVGMLEMATLTSHEIATSKAGECMQLLSERYLVGADASIVEFMRSADERPCRLTVSGERISGLVCLYDMQELPARAALFAMIAQLEMTMADVISTIYDDSSEWLDRLTADRREKIDREIADAKKDDAFVKPLLYTQFGDKVTILRKDPCIQQKNRFRHDMKAIHDLRDNLVHANEYASTRDACKGVCQSVRNVEFWLASLVGWQGDANSRRGQGTQRGQ